MPNKEIVWNCVLEPDQYLHIANDINGIGV